MNIDKVVNGICNVIYTGMVAGVIWIAADAWFGSHDDGQHADFIPRYV